MMNNSRFFASGAGVAAALGALAGAAYGQNFQGTLQQFISTGTFSIPEPPPPGAPELLHISITDAFWLTPGEVQFTEAGSTALSDRIIFLNTQSSTGGLQANILFGSDDEQGNLPPNLPPIGIVPVIGAFPEGQPLTLPFGVQDASGVSTTLLITMISDGDPSQPGAPSDQLSVPSPATGVLIGAGMFMMRRRRK
jgi:hypothetical protein